MTHPGRRRFAPAALALQQAGMLTRRLLGPASLPLWRRRWSVLPRSCAAASAGYTPVPFDQDEVRWMPSGSRPAVRLGDALLPPRRRLDRFRGLPMFNRWAAVALPEARAGAVPRLRDLARGAFPEARRLGLKTLLDAPSIHHTGAGPPARHHRSARSPPPDRAPSRRRRSRWRITSSPSRRWRARPISTPECRRRRSTPWPSGADTALFTPRPAPQADETPEPATFTFLFAGASIRRKGFDLLLDAFSPRGGPGGARPPAHRRPARRCRGLSGAASLRRRRGAAAHRSGRPRRRAAPRRLPGATARATTPTPWWWPRRWRRGVPALISEMVGAEDLITDGESGWIVPVGDVPALAARMLWCARHPTAVRAMRDACRRAAAAATWPAYHRRLAALVRDLVAR